MSDLCKCGHWSRHHTIGKHDGRGHCDCKGFDAEIQTDVDISLYGFAAVKATYESETNSVRYDRINPTSIEPTA